MYAHLKQVGRVPPSAVIPIALQLRFGAQSTLFAGSSSDTADEQQEDHILGIILWRAEAK